MRGKRVGWGLAVLAGLVLVATTGAVLAHGEKEEKETRERLMIFHGRAWLGVQIDDVTPERVQELKLPGEYGALVKEVESESPAAKAGLQANDVIVSFAEERVRSAAQLRRLVQETPAGRKVPVQVSRAGQLRSFEVTLEERRPEILGGRLRIPEFHVPPIEIPDFDINIFRRGPRLGVSGEELTPQLADYFAVKQGKGVLVREVLAGSAAAKAGLKAGDVIVRVDDQQVATVSDLREALARERKDKEVTLTIVRDRSERTVKVELDEPQPYSPRRTAHRHSRELMWLPGGPAIAAPPPPPAPPAMMAPMAPLAPVPALVPLPEDLEWEFAPPVLVLEETI